jgi:hypothetical protein
MEDLLRLEGTGQLARQFHAAALQAYLKPVEGRRRTIDDRAASIHARAEGFLGLMVADDLARRWRRRLLPALLNQACLQLFTSLPGAFRGSPAAFHARAVRLLRLPTALSLTGRIGRRLVTALAHEAVR